MYFIITVAEIGSFYNLRVLPVTRSGKFCYNDEKRMTQTPADHAPREQAVDAKIRKSRFLWALPFCAIFLPIVLLSLYSLQIASQSVRSVVESQNLTAAYNLAQQLTQAVKENVALAHAIASLDGTLAAIRDNDQVTLRMRLKAITVSRPEIHRAFFVNTGAVVINEFPTASGAYGSNFSDVEWFREFKITGKPVISGLYQRAQYPGEPAIAIAVPSRDGEHELGTLVFEYRAREIEKWLRSSEIGSNGYMLVVDHMSALVANPHVDTNDLGNKSYADATLVRDALGGAMQTSEYVDPLSGITMLATFVPISVGSHTWVVIAQQSRDAAFGILDSVKVNLGVAGAILTLFTLTMVVALARVSAKNIKLNEDLAFKNQSLKDFTSIVSHQLKAPITAMRWNIESILDGDYGPIADDLRKVLQDLHAVNVSNYTLIMDILNVSRLDRGVVAVELKAVKLRDIVDRAIRDYVIAAERAGLYLNVEEPVPGIVVQADLEKAAECIMNSISNALKHTKQGGITVRLKSADGKGIVEVADTGEGMLPDILKNLFSRDGIRKSNTGAESSSGLGLYIARQFMQLQGGDIEATAVTGKGSTFTYTLKLSTDVPNTPQKTA